MNNIAYIYALIDPISSHIRYIGKACNPQKRFDGHLKENRRNIHKVNWIKKLTKENLIPELFILEEVAISEWQFWEQYYISLYKSWNFDLINMTVGGEGGDTISNHFDKVEIRKRMAINIGMANRGKIRTVAHKKQTSLAGLNEEKFECEHCHRFYKQSNLDQWHNNKCLENINLTKEEKDKLILQRKTGKRKQYKKRQKQISKNIKCNYCNFIGTNSAISRYHNNYCYEKPGIDKETEKLRRNKCLITNKERKKFKQKREICTICKEEHGQGVIKRSHNDRCKYKLNA